MSRIQEIAKDLRALSHHLNSWDKHVRNAEVLCKIFPKEKTSGVLDYMLMESTPLIFQHIDIEPHSRPAGIEKLPKHEQKSEVTLTAMCKERSKTKPTQDPLLGLGVNIAIQATFKEKPHHCSWHLDRDNRNHKENFSHPVYHLNFGGQQMTKRGIEYPNLLLMPAPRTIHFPMEIILACDFIVHNFYSKSTHSRLTNMPGYVGLLKRTRERYWKPFANAISSEWYPERKVDDLTHQMIIGR